jgi:hypothetical protein
MKNFKFHKFYLTANADETYYAVVHNTSGGSSCHPSFNPQMTEAKLEELEELEKNNDSFDYLPETRKIIQRMVDESYAMRP